MFFRIKIFKDVVYREKIKNYFLLINNIMKDEKN